jgi:pyruvate dehydrogenase complex dehydrogenase (E1) component
MTDLKAHDDTIEITHENREWLDSLEYVHAGQGPDRVFELLRLLQVRAHQRGVHVPFSANTPYISTIARGNQPVFPGSREIERRIKSIKVGIYSHVGQSYEPVDKNSLLYYKEATDGQILEEGITEAGSMSSFIAAGTAYSTFDVNMVPFFFFYSMFGFQRIGDLIWAAGDSQARGFLLGATAGRTTLAGEGLQHQDGHSHMLACGYLSVLAYDPAYAYEIAVIVREGLRRMLEDGENVIYYLTIMNEFYKMPAMPPGIEAQILNGLYKLRGPLQEGTPAAVHLLGSGAILNEALATLVREQRLPMETLKTARDALEIDPMKINPLFL